MKRKAFSAHEDVYLEHLKNSAKNNMPVGHYHDMYEFYLQLDGKRYMFCDNVCHILERGDMALLEPFVIHYGESRDSDYYERYVLNFRKDVLKRVLNEDELLFLEGKLKSCVVHLSEEQLQSMINILEEISVTVSEKGFLSDKVLSSGILRLLMLAVKNIDNKPSLEGERIPKQIASAFEYIYKNCTEDLSVEMIADYVNMSKYHFCRKFKEITGSTVLEYINNVRLAKACNMLMHTNTRIEEISELSGFSSAAQLTRVFKKRYGVSPSVYRKKLSNN